MASAWKELPGNVPADGVVVWVRRFWFAAPWLGTWSLAGQTFTSASGLVVPWYEVSRWRAP